MRVGVDAPELEVTSLSHLGEQGASALELFVEPLDPPAAAAGAGTDSSKRGSAASSAGSGPTIFPFSDIEVDRREVELEEPFAGPDVDWDGQDPPGEGAAAVCAAPVDPVGETIPNSSDQVHQDPEHSLGNTQAASADQDLPVPVEKGSNSLNLVDQDQPVPTLDEPEEFVPPERLIAQASSTPHIPPVTTSNNFDPLGDDEESTVEDEENEDIARRIQEQHDLEAALEATAVEAGVEPEPANVESGGQQPESEGGEAAASSAGQGERDRTRRRGCRAGAKHVPGRENLAYGKTSEYIIAQLYARFGSRFHLPHIPPKVARKQYQEWFGYVTRHSDRWAFRTDGELLPVDIILQWATMLPELWQFLYWDVPRRSYWLEEL